MSKDLDEERGFRAGFLEHACGVSSRYYCGEETQIDLAVAAAAKALDNAGIEANEIDLVISGCGIPYQTLPTTAPLVQGRLGIGDGAAAAFDVNSTCLSFLNAFETASRLLQAEEYGTALVFSSEIASRALPWAEQPEEAALFGDGAAAVVLTRSAAGRASVRAFLTRTYPSAYQACQIGAGGTRLDFQNDRETFVENSLFRMNGKELYRTTSRHFSAFVDDLLARAGWEKGDVDVLIPHQASPFALSHIAKQIKFPKSKIVDISRLLGNQIAASIPTALDRARQQGRLPAGTKALFLGTSAGVSFGGMAYEF